MRLVLDSTRRRCALFAVLGIVDFFLVYKLKQYWSFPVVAGLLAGFSWKGFRGCCADFAGLIGGFGVAVPIMLLVMMKGMTHEKMMPAVGMFIPFAGFGLLLCLPGFAIGVIISRLALYGWSKASRLSGVDPSHASKF